MQACATTDSLFDKFVEVTADVVPPIHVSTTFTVDNPCAFHYARNDQPTRHRAETLIGDLEKGLALLYSSGMATVWAVLTHYRPKRVVIERGYHGLQAEFQKGDIIWLETPRNPTSELYDIDKYVQKSRVAGAILVVDSTFASPVLQKPLLMGADLVMHSCTKYISGHDDVLSGALITKDKKVHDALLAERTILGSLPGSLECFLLIRSIHTLSLRVLKQSSTACKLAKYFQNHPKVDKVWHPSLPTSLDYELCRRQMVAPPAVLSVEFKTIEITQSVLKNLQLFVPATSLGGCVSLVDWRHAYVSEIVSSNARTPLARDSTQPPTLLRISTGLEDPADLIADLEYALRD